MTEQKINEFLASRTDWFPPEKNSLIRNALKELPEDKESVLYAFEPKNPTTVLICSIFVGSWGIDRFILGDVGLGILKLLTCGGAWIWWLIDVISAKKMTREYNYKKFSELLMQQGITIM